MARVTKRKIPARHGIKNPKNMAKWQKKLVRREHARKAAGKKPLAEPLTMSREGVVGGKIVLRDGPKEVAVSMKNGNGALQGVYRLGKKIIVARNRTGRNIYPETLTLYELRNGHETPAQDSYEKAYFEIPEYAHDMGHMYLPKEFRGTGLAERHASRVDRHERQRKSGKNVFYMSGHRARLFERLLKKIKYKQEKVEKHDIWIYHKKGRARKEANLRRFHLIEAIDPKTGKKREYAFPIRES